jgi:hypothetical protein
VTASRRVEAAYSHVIEPALCEILKDVELDDILGLIA